MTQEAAGSYPTKARRSPASPSLHERLPVVLPVVVAYGCSGLVIWCISEIVNNPPSDRAGWLGAGARLCGLLGSYLLLVEVLLVARLPWLERDVPVIVLRRWHARNGRLLLTLIVLHACLAVAVEAARTQSPFVGAAIGMVLHFPHVMAAAAGLALLVMAAATSARSVRARIAYGWWHLLHLSTYAAVGLGFAHQLLGADLVGSAGTALWTGMHVLVGVLVLWFRVVAPVRASLRHRLRVTAVIREAPDVVSVWVRGRRIEQLQARPGQYLRWRILTRWSWFTAHPYSLSAPPGPDGLRFTVKAVGNHSRALGRVRVGTRIAIEGPYGALTECRRRRQRVLLLAGGLGIAPLRALLEVLTADPGELTLIYRVGCSEDVIFRDEIDDLARRRGVGVHYLAGPPGGEGRPEPLAPERLTDLVPALRWHDVYVCGPTGMVTTAVTSLRTAGVDHRHIHTETLSF